MPSKTPKQARAMRAAAAGNSTIGIPQSVGRKYVRADKKKRSSMKAGHGRTTARRGNRRSK